MSTTRRAITAVELLVVCAIIGVLIALLLPAIQAARESARSASCKSHLRQLGLAAEQHHEALRHYPTGGWGYRWVGDPDRGFGLEQPGGWIYNILPYVEYGNLRELGRGGGNGKNLDLMKLVAVPIPIFHCPSRRRATVYPFLGRTPLVNIDKPSQAAKCDYAGNGGDTMINHRGGGPSSLSNSVVASYQWADTAAVNGIFYLRSQVRSAVVSDGLSHVYFVGEKCLSARPHDPTRRDSGDDQTLYLGDDRDIRRWTDRPPERDSVKQAPLAFGSSHPSGCNFLFGDSSVRLIRYDVEADIHRRLGNRSDGDSINADDL